MTRLTKDIRTSIAMAAIEHAFDPRTEALSKAEDALAREAYASIIPEAETKAVNKLPENWIRRDACLRFNAAGYRVRLQTKGKSLPVPYAPHGSASSGYGCNEIGTIKHGDLADRVQLHVRAVEALKEERRTAYRQVLVMLEAVTTVARLKEVWPEGEQFFGRFADAGKASLPTVRVAEINATLGLAA